jgi:hypothetical protein
MQAGKLNYRTGDVGRQREWTLDRQKNKTVIRKGRRENAGKVGLTEREKVGIQSVPWPKIRPAGNSSSVSASPHRQEVASRLEDLELVLGEAARREQGEEDTSGVQEDDSRPDTVKVRDSNP